MKSPFIAAAAIAFAAGCGAAPVRPVGQAPANDHAFSLTPAQIAARALPAVVTVKSDRGFGTGFVVKKDGWVATNFHVVAGASKLTVLIPERGEFPVLEMLLLDEEDDLAVVRIGEADLPVLSIGDSHAVRAGDPVVAIGHPLGFDHTVSNGLVSAVRDIGKFTLFQISAPIAPGSSGGPLLNDRGEVIGIVSATVTNGQNLNFGVPAAYLKAGLLDTKAVPFEKFAAAAGPGLPEPKHDVAHHEVTMLRGCSEGDLRLLQAILAVSIAEASGAYDAKHFEASDYLLEGASLDAERRLSTTCSGPKRALVDARKTAGKRADPFLATWAMRDGFEGIIEVIQRKLK